MLRAGGAARRAAPPHRDAPVRGAALRRHPARPHPGRGVATPGFPMSQFDKDDVEDLGLLKLDVLGIRMQSAMAHAVTEIERVDGVEIDLDDEAQVPFDDPTTYAMISSRQDPRRLPDRVAGPARAGRQVRASSPSTTSSPTSRCSGPGRSRATWSRPTSRPSRAGRSAAYLHDDLRPILERDPRRGGLPRAGDRDHRPVRRRLLRRGRREAARPRRPRGDGRDQARGSSRGPSAAATRWRVVEQVWKVLEAFASFGFCKAHAAAFALPTYQSAWLKAHWPAHFLAGVLTHDPGMYPKRLILDDARQFGIAVLGLDVNVSAKALRRGARRDERCARAGAGLARRAGLRHPAGAGRGQGHQRGRGRADRRPRGPYDSLTDFWHRAQVSRPVVERLVLAGGFDTRLRHRVGRRRRSGGAAG